MSNNEKDFENIAKGIGGTEINISVGSDSNINILKMAKESDDAIIERLNEIDKSLDEIQEPYLKHSRSINHMYKPNNWLKMNGMTMRRKPFKRKYIRYMLDEFYNI